MIIDTSRLLEEIQSFEDKEVPDWETCPISKLNALERVALRRREVIREFRALAEEFGDCIVVADVDSVESGGE
jgi:hypothetical protein